METFSTVRAPLLTCEAVLSEAAYLLRRLTGGPEKAIELLTRGVLTVPFRLEGEAPAVKKLLARYGNVPMDLADACLVRLTELHADCVLLTVDSDFRDVYRRNGRQAIPTVLPR